MRLPSSQQPELSPNCQAFPYVEQLANRSRQLRTNVAKRNGVTVIDCGVQVPGGWEAGILFASTCLGGLAKVDLHWSDRLNFHWPYVEVRTDQPLRACLASQYAGWPLKNGNKVVMGSGPIRSILHEGDIFEKLGYHDESETAIICLESETLPTDDAISQIIKGCRRVPTSLYILVAPTASLAGSVQVSARALETGLSKLMLLGYDLGRIISGLSTCPVPPVIGNNLQALARTNAAILYGSTVLFNLQDEDKNLKSIVQQVPSSLSQDDDHAFEEVLKCQGNFYDLDPFIFSPAEVWLNNMNSGNSFHAGRINIELLRKSFCLRAQNT